MRTSEAPAPPLLVNFEIKRRKPPNVAFPRQCRDKTKHPSSKRLTFGCNESSHRVHSLLWKYLPNLNDKIIKHDQTTLIRSIDRLFVKREKTHNSLHYSTTLGNHKPHCHLCVFHLQYLHAVAQPLPHLLGLDFV